MEGNRRWGEGRAAPPRPGPPLIVVLGHQRCGAVKAAYKAMHDRTTLPGNLQAISGSLRTAYEATVAQKAADRVDAMTRIHARQTAAAPALRHLAAERRTHPGR